MYSEGFLEEKWLKKLDYQTKVLLDRTGLDRKTFDQVFNTQTLLDLGKLISDHVIDILDCPISTGKEANIFRGVTPKKKFVAVKIYRTSTLTFKHISEYIRGDPRFKTSNKNRRELVFEWAKKESKNLERLHEAKVRAPRPLKRLNNILVMEYIGDAVHPAPLLKDVDIKDPQEMFKTIETYMIKMYRDARLVHADLSPYNILVYRQKPYVIDVGQAVLLDHPRAPEFLHRDVHNIVQYFKRYNIKVDEQRMFEKISKKT